MATESTKAIPGAIWRRLCYFRRTERLVRHLRASPGEDLTLEDAADIAGMEKAAFSRLFHREIGTTFSDFHRVYSLHLAVEHMLTSNISVKELAHTVGFKCVSTFTRNFKKEIGLSPARFRAHLRKCAEPLPEAGPGTAPSSGPRRRRFRSSVVP